MDNDATTKSLEVIASGAYILTVGLVVARVAGYAFRYFVALISPEALGIFSLVMTFQGIIAVFAFLGIRSGLVRHVSFYRGREDWPRVKGTIVTSLKIVMSMSLLVALTIVLISKPLARLFFHSSEAKIYLLFIAALLPIFTAKQLLLNGMTAFKEITYRVVVFGITENISKVVFCGLLILMGLKVWAALLGYALSVITALILGVFVFEFRIFPIFRSRVVGVPIYGEILRYSTPLLFSGVIGLALAWTDNLMLGYFLTVRDVGFYSVALLLSSLAFLGAEICVPLFFPSINEMYAQGRSEGIKGLYLTVTKWSLALGLPVCVLLVAMPTAIITLLFGPLYSAAAVALIFLSIGRLLSSFCFTAIQMIKMRLKTHYFFWVTLATAILNVVLNLWWIPLYGINGAAAATATSLAFRSAMFLWLCFREFGYHAFSPSIAKLAILGLGLGAGLALVAGRVSHSLGALLLAAILFGLVYLGLSWVVGVQDEQDRLVWATVRTKLGLRFGSG